MVHTAVGSPSSRISLLPGFSQSLMKMALTLLAFVGAIPLAHAQGVPSDYRVGVYYYPGWKPTPKDDPWKVIRPYAERTPLLGFYSEGDQNVMDTHLQWMNHWGINFVLYDWYWSADNTTYLDHALQAHLASRKRGLVKFAVNWCNHTELVPKDEANFLTMVDYWIKNYFGYDCYLTQDGKPVVVIFSPQELYDVCRKKGMTSKSLLEKARAKARAAGYPGIYFLGVAAAIDDYVNGLIVGDGYDGVTAYGYNRGYSGQRDQRPLTTSYSELEGAYRENWNWMMSKSKLPYWVPVISGWDKHPWGSNTPHDNCVSTPAQFREHLTQAKALLDQYPQKTQKTIVIYAWNEYGEGGYIEPTKKYQYEYLQSIYKVFREH